MVPWKIIGHIINLISKTAIMWDNGVYIYGTFSHSGLKEYSIITHFSNFHL